MRALLGLGLAGLLAAGCAATRVVPVPEAGVALDAATHSARREAEGVRVVVRSSAWKGNPTYLPQYVTPFHLLIANDSPVPLRYDYGDLRLFDTDRFQYTALPPIEVARILRAGWGRTPGAVPGPTVVAAAGASLGALHRRRFGWDPWEWGPPWWYPPYYPYPLPPSVDEVLREALPVGTLQPGARTQGFVYFPRLRPEAERLTFEFHYALGDAPRVLTLPFAVERTDLGGRPGAS
ncbi:MAG TPA: hypothetical protein VGW35_08965 [Methylomirabilota bacterium]|nr:hypothetical protein [Methylomirabilota bacterium]